MTKNKKLKQWVREITALCQPDSVHWCNGSQEERAALEMRLETWGLSPETRFGSLLEKQ
jgi:phosphoenolpyruvate carboxykinase (GTP)